MGPGGKHMRRTLSKAPKLNHEWKETTGPLTIGIDLGDRYSQCCVLDSQGEIIAEGRLSSTQDALENHFKGVTRVRIAIEAGAHSRWVSELLSGYGHEVLVANPRNLQLISNSIRKSDRVDARALARLARVDPSLLSPLTHRKSTTYPHMAQLRARHALVRSRTSIVNAVRGMAKAVGLRLPTCSTETFASKVSPLLPDDLKASLLPLLETIVTLNLQIQKCDRAIYHLAKYKYPETERLRQVSGVGVNTALEFVLTIENPHRFQKSRQVGAYLGIQPKQRDSGERTPQLGITKAGNSSLRSLLIQCAHYLLGPFGKDCDLRRWGVQLAARGGKNAKKRAIVAVARKMAVLLHRLWVTGEEYKPFRQQPQLAQAAA